MIGRPLGLEHIRERFGRLLILKRILGKSPDGHSLFLCKCDCGKDKEVRYDHLTRNQRKNIISSCGCHQKEVMRERGKRNRLENHPQWKGGVTIGNGYKLVSNGFPRKRTPEHRLVWEVSNGLIPKGCVIHHLNGDKLDNRIENLSCLSKSEHHGRKIFEPYEKRIKELELKLKEVR